MRLYLPFLCTSLFATTTITSIEPTATQAIIRVNTTQSGNCTYRISQGLTLGSLGVNDVNTSIFTGSNSDARFGSIVSGGSHIFVAGTRSSQAISMKGVDGNFYSRALKAYTQHTVGVTCSPDAEVTQVFTTLNPGFGSPGPEWQWPMDTTGFGNEAWPTVFWNNLQTTLSQTDGNGKDQSIIDPLTGFLLKRAQGPGQFGWPFNDYQTATGAAFIVGTATNWTTPGNAILNTSSSADCSGTCVTAKNPITIIAPIPTSYPSQPPGYQQTLQTMDDFQLKVQGCDDAAASTDRVFQAAISLHPQLQTVNSNWINLPAIVQCSPIGSVTTTSIVTGPATFPTPFLASWAGGNGIKNSELNQRTGVVNCTSAVCTLASGNPFNINWVNGDAITIAGSSATCPSNVCLIASMQSGNKLTLQQNLTISTANYTQNPVAFLIRKNTTTGAAHLNNVTYNIDASNQSGAPTNGDFRLFSTVNSTTTYNRAGTNDGVSRTGYCMASGNSGGGYEIHFFIPASGESRYLTAISITNYPVWSTTAACTWFGIDASNNLLQYQYNDTTFKDNGYDATKGANTCYNNGVKNANCAGTSNVTTTTLLASATFISQITSAYATYGGTYNATYFPSWSIHGSLGDAVMVYATFNNVQDMLTVRCYYSIAGNNIFACVDTFTKAPASWGVMHSGPPHGTAVAGNTGHELVGINPLANGAWQYGASPAVQVDVNCVVSRDATCATPITGYCSSNTGSDSQGSCAGSWVDCPANSFGAPTAPGSAQCVHIKFNNQPAIKTPNSVNTSFLAAYPWCSGQAGRSGVWSFLKPLVAGDSLKNWTSGNIYMDWLRVLSVTGSTCDGIIDVWLWHDWNGWVAFGSGDPPTSASGTLNSLAPGTPLYPFEGCAAIWYKISTGTPICDPSPLSLNHSDYAQAGTADSGTLIGSGATRFYVRTGPNPSTITSVWESYTNYLPTFAGSQAYSSVFQSHLSLGVADLTANPFYVDGKNAASANGGVNAYGVTITGPIAPFNSVYKVSISGTLDRKRLPFFVKAGRFLLADISGPTAAITDSTTSSYCVIEYGNVCGLSGTSPGDVYVNAPFLNTAGTTNCANQDMDAGSVCAFTTAVNGQYIFQQSTAFDSDKSHYRVLSSLIGGHQHEQAYFNGIPTPKGDWVVAANQWTNGFTSHNWMIQMLPYPTDTTVPNNQYVSVPLSIGAGAGTKARVRFGYIENEPSGSTSIHFYATSRLESANTCTISTDPFSYNSEASTCPATPATLSIPALPGHVLYYIVDRLDNSTGIVTSGPLQVIAIP